MKIHEGWLAGFVDGEGCFKVTEQYKNGRIYGHHSIMLSQSGDHGREVLQAIQAEYGGQLYLHLRAGEHKATKDAWKLYWRRDEGAIFIRRILDKLILKRQDAETVLAYIERERTWKKSTLKPRLQKTFLDKNMQMVPTIPGEHLLNVL